MLLHYLKVPSFSVLITQYSWQSQSHCRIMYYALFNNLNSLHHKVLLQKVLERKHPSGTTPWNNHLARLFSSFNSIEIFLPGTEHSWANKLSNQGLQRRRGQPWSAVGECNQTPDLLNWSSWPHPYYAQWKRAPATKLIIFCPNLFINYLYTFSLTSVLLFRIHILPPLSKTQGEYVYPGSLLMVTRTSMLFSPCYNSLPISLIIFTNLKPLEHEWLETV